jgi:hypothetical protein
MRLPVVFREVLKTFALAAGALIIVTACALELEAWAVRTSREQAQNPVSREQGRLIRSHTVDQPTIGVIT